MNAFHRYLDLCPTSLSDLLSSSTDSALISPHLTHIAVFIQHSETSVVLPSEREILTLVTTQNSAGTMELVMTLQFLLLRGQARDSEEFLEIVAVAFAALDNAALATEYGRQLFQILFIFLEKYAEFGHDSTATAVLPLIVTEMNRRIAESEWPCAAHPMSYSIASILNILPNSQTKSEFSKKMIKICIEFLEKALSAPEDYPPATWRPLVHAVLPALDYHQEIVEFVISLLKSPGFDPRIALDLTCIFIDTLPVSKVNSEITSLIRSGLLSKDSLVRRQSVHLLKETDKSPEIDVFLLIFSTLEEEAMHLLKGVWKQINQLPISWRWVLYEKAVTTDNPNVRRFAFQSFWISEFKFQNSKENSLKIRNFCSEFALSVLQPLMNEASWWNSVINEHNKNALEDLITERIVSVLSEMSETEKNQFLVSFLRTLAVSRNSSPALIAQFRVLAGLRNVRGGIVQTNEICVLLREICAVNLTESEPLQRVFGYEMTLRFLEKSRISRDLSVESVLSVLAELPVKLWLESAHLEALRECYCDWLSSFDYSEFAHFSETFFVSFVLFESEKSVEIVRNLLPKFTNSELISFLQTLIRFSDLRKLFKKTISEFFSHTNVREMSDEILGISSHLLSNSIPSIATEFTRRISLFLTEKAAAHSDLLLFPQPHLETETKTSLLTAVTTARRGTEHHSKNRQNWYSNHWKCIAALLESFTTPLPAPLSRELINQCIDFMSVTSDQLVPLITRVFSLLVSQQTSALCFAASDSIAANAMESIRQLSISFRLTQSHIQHLVSGLLPEKLFSDPCSCRPGCVPGLFRGFVEIAHSTQNLRIIDSLLFHCIPFWTAYPETLLPLAQDLARICYFYKEDTSVLEENARFAAHSLADRPAVKSEEAAVLLANAKPSSTFPLLPQQYLARATLLTFLDSFMAEFPEKSLHFVTVLTGELCGVLRDSDAQVFMTFLGVPESLRMFFIWETLGLLISCPDSAATLPVMEILQIAYSALSRGIAPELRQLIEYVVIKCVLIHWESHAEAFAALCVEWMATLSSHRMSVSVSLVTVVGQVIIELVHSGRVSSSEWINRVLPTLVVLSTGNSGHLRTIAQYYFFHIMREVAPVFKIPADLSLAVVLYESQKRDATLRKMFSRLEKQLTTGKAADVFHRLSLDSILFTNKVHTDTEEDSRMVVVVTHTKRIVKDYLTALKKVYDDYVSDECEKHRVGEAIRDFQVKITPYDTLAKESGVSQSTRSALEADAVANRSAMIVCASLVDKNTNLGGIARTSEIFNVDSMVLHDVRSLEARDFKALSVSAEEWLPFTACKRDTDSVAGFLKRKKREGYTIVALEQTQNSVMLNEVQFPEKIVLLLGKERTGVPAELLHLVDLCVEIPQFGITRSLNVHVSAAICIWEYTRQHRLLK